MHLIIVSLFLGCISICAQKPVRVFSNLSSCEEMVRSLDVAAIVFNKIPKDTIHGEKSKLILIVGSSSSKNRQHDLARLQQAANYLSTERKVLREQVIYGIGPSQGPLSYMAFYVEGKLVSEINTSPKGRLCKADNERL